MYILFMLLSFSKQAKFALDSVRLLAITCTLERCPGGGGGGGPSIPYPFNYFEKYPISLIIPKIQKALYPHISIIDPSIPYPFKYLQKYPKSL